MFFWLFFFLNQWTNMKNKKNLSRFSRITRKKKKYFKLVTFTIGVLTLINSKCHTLMKRGSSWWFCSKVWIPKLTFKRCGSYVNDFNMTGRGLKVDIDKKYINSQHNQVFRNQLIRWFNAKNMRMFPKSFSLNSKQIGLIIELG